MSFLQLAGENPICHESRRRRALAFFLFFSWIA